MEDLSGPVGPPYCCRLPYYIVYTFRKAVPLKLTKAYGSNSLTRSQLTRLEIRGNNEGYYCYTSGKINKHVQSKVNYW